MVLDLGDKAREEALGNGIARRGHLRVPLDGDEPAALGLEALDEAVTGPGGRDKPGADPLHALVVAGASPRLGRTERRGKSGPWSNTEVVVDPAAGADPTVSKQRRIVRQVLDEGATKGDVHDLKAATDPEQGDAEAIGRVDEADLDRVPIGLDSLSRLVDRGLSVGRGVDVAPSREEHTVQLGDEFLGVVLGSREQDGPGTATLQRCDIGVRGREAAACPAGDPTRAEVGGGNTDQGSAHPTRVPSGVQVGVRPGMPIGPRLFPEGGWRASGRWEGNTAMAKFAELLSTARSAIHEVDPDGVAALGEDVLFLDVREADEYEQGALPGAVHLPRGYLELQVEGRVPDKSRPIVVYCAGGVRSAFAAHSLHQLGYEKVWSLAGGFNRWKDRDLAWAVPRSLDRDQRNRYQRHLLMPEVGVEGQQRLLSSKVLLLGAGGLGSPAALYLAAAGVGTIGIVDMDVVDASNLQRQVLHNLERVGQRKVDSARQTINAMNPDVEVATYDVRLGADNICEIFHGYDVIVDGTDNFPTRYLVNDASVLMRIPVVHGSIFRFEGQMTVFSPYVGPCYRCLVPEPPPADLAPSCAEAGVLGVLPGIVGSIQAVETIKLLLGIGTSLVGRLLAYDALGEEFHSFNIRRDPACPTCGESAGEIVIAEYEGLCMPHRSSDT